MRVCALARPSCHNCSACTFMNITPHTPRISPVSVARWATFQRWLPRAPSALRFFARSTHRRCRWGRWRSLLAILDANPHARGTVFDQPHVVEAARQAIHAKNYQAVARPLAGISFEAVPAGADLYVLKFILVDWKDEEALRILQNCRTAISPDGKLLVIEMTIPDDQ